MSRKYRLTTHEKRLQQVAYKLNVKESLADDVISNFFSFMKKRIEACELPHGDLLTEEEFKAKTIIAKIPHLGYLVPSYGKHKAVTKHKAIKIKS